MTMGHKWNLLFLSAIDSDIGTDGNDMTITTVNNQS